MRSNKEVFCGSYFHSVPFSSVQSQNTKKKSTLIGVLARKLNCMSKSSMTSQNNLQNVDNRKLSTSFHWLHKRRRRRRLSIRLHFLFYFVYNCHVITPTFWNPKSMIIFYSYLSGGLYIGNNPPLRFSNYRMNLLLLDEFLLKNYNRT